MRVASHAPSTGDMAHHPGMCPALESNWQYFGSQAGTQSTTETQEQGKRSNFNAATFLKLVFCQAMLPEPSYWLLEKLL